MREQESPKQKSPKTEKGAACMRCELSGITVGRLVHMLSHQLKRQSTLDDAALGLTTMQSHVLRFILLGCEGRDVYQKDVEEEFEVRKPTATGILQLLEKNGFIVREAVAEDARLKRIVPTKKARALREQIVENIQKRDRELTAGIPQEELKACKETLLKMILNARELQNLDKDEVQRRT